MSWSQVVVKSWCHDVLSIFLFIIFCCNVLIFSWYLFVLPSLSTGLSVYCILWLWILPTTTLIKWYWYWPLGVHVIAGEGESEYYLAINYNVSCYPPQALIPLKNLKHQSLHFAIIRNVCLKSRLTSIFFNLRSFE